MKTVKFLFLAGLLSACSSTQHSFENRIQVGMDKAEVLEICGGPQLTKRRNSEDVWQYFFYSGDQKSVRELHFKNNKVSYKGEPVGPKPGDSAKAIDARNSRLLPSYGASPAEAENLTPKQKQENLERYIKEDEETQSKKSDFKEI